jgi:tetratricopeptide (TPR) repeat protein
MTEDRLSLADIIRRRQHASFVGRQERRSQFGRNLNLPADDPRRLFIFNIHGNAGVGKSYLTKQLQREAEHRGTACGYVDESSFDVPEVMAKLTLDLTRAGYPLKRLEKQLATYKAHRHQLESDPMAPPGTFEFIAQTALRTVLQAAKAVPGGGIAAEIVDPAAAAEQAERLRSYLSKKLRRTDDIRLVLSPTEVLTPVFVEDLAAIGKQLTVALFFDTFERTGTFIEGWLLDLLDGRYGALPGDLAITIAGQSPLNANRWASYRSIMADVPLTEFTAAEASELLDHAGVRDPQVRDVILELSGGLPLLVAMLAEGSPVAPEDIGDRSGDAIERFLRWEQDPRRRELALTAAFLRIVDEDTLAVATSESDAREHYDWLLHRPFVTPTAGRCRYHDVVRAPMLRLQRTQSPARWRRLHTELAENFRRLRSALSADKQEGAWGDDEWQRYAVEEVYHRLCADPSSLISDALRDYTSAYKEGAAVARRWSQMLNDAAKDTDSDVLRQWSRQLAALEEAADTDLADVLTLFVNDSRISPDDLETTLLLRANVYRDSQRLMEAIGDYTKVLAVNPSRPEAWSGRGEAHRLHEDWELAVRDFSRALAINERDAWSLGSRGQAHAAADRPEEALADLSGAIAMAPDLDWALLDRGRLLAGIDRMPEALADFDRALELDPDDGWTLMQRASAYVTQNRHTEALADYTRAIELDEIFDSALLKRAELYLKTDEYEQAMADYDRAIEIDEENDWAHTERASLFILLGQHEKALTDFARAIEIDNENDWAYTERAEFFVELKQYEKAMADFDRAIEIDPEYMYALVQRAELHTKLKQYEKAMADLDRAVELDPVSAWAVAQRADTLLTQSRHAEAANDLDQAIRLDPSYRWARTRRAWTHCVRGNYEQAESDYRIAAAADPSDPYSALGVTRSALLQGKEWGTFLELTHATVTAAPDTPETHYYLGYLLMRQGQPDAGRRSIMNALNLAWQECYEDPDDDGELGVGLCLAALGEYDLAEKYLMAARGVSPDLRRLLADELNLLISIPVLESHRIGQLIQKL